MTIDKKAHFWAGAAIAATVTLYTASPVFGIVAAVLIGALKELRDRVGFGTPDLMDFAATAAGSAVVLPLLL